MLVSRGVAAGEIPGGGNGGPLAIGTAETAATRAALFPALATTLMSMFACSSGVIDGEAARPAAEAAFVLLFQTGVLVLGRIRLGAADVLTSAEEPGANTSVNTAPPRLSGVLGRECRVNLFAGGDEALPLGLIDLCLVAATEAACDSPRLPCADATRARSN